LRGLPPYTSESDVVSFFSSFPGVSLTRILLLPNSNQAFLQLQTVEQAAQLVHLQAQQGGHLMIKGNKAVIVQFSNRQEIHTPATMAAAGGVAGGAAGAAAAAMQGGVIGGVAPDSQQAANSILIVTVLNTRVPVTLDHIHQIFKPCGDVLKIITFHKNGVFKALVQLASVEAAVHARHMLEGKDIFQGCCHLRIGFSSLHELHVKTPGANARDFTSPTGATQTFGAEGGAYGHSGGFQQGGLIHNNGGFGAGGYPDAYGQSASAAAPAHHAGGQAAPSAPQQQMVQQPPVHPSAPGCVVLVSNLPEERATCDVLFTLFGVYGDVQRVKILYNKRDTALIQFLSPQSAYLAALHLNHLHLYGKQISVTPSKHVEVSLPKAAGHPGQTQADAEQQLSGLTQDYTHSPIHRFRRTAGAAGTVGAGGGLGIHAKSIHPPSQVLHVSSLADAVTEEELRQLFASQPNGAAAAAANGEPSEEKEAPRQVPVVQFFTSTPKGAPGMSQPLVSAPKLSKQAFLRFDSVAAAVEALIDFHNRNLHGRYLRISFSGKDPAQVHDTLNGAPVQQQHGTQQQQGAGAVAAASSPSGSTTAAAATGGNTASPSSPNANGAVAGTAVSPSAGGAEGQAAHQE